MATTSSQENSGLLDQSIPQWKRELILRRRALARTLPAGNTSVKLTCPSVVTAVRHPELAAAAGENVSGKQQRCISSAIASNKGVLDQTQADFHPRGRSNDSSSASTISTSVVGNMRLVEHQVEVDTDLMINGVGLDITVEQSSGKYRSRMGEEKYVKKSSASSRTIVDNSVVNMTKNHLMMNENNNCQHSNEEEECESDSSEELQYGPGIVNKLKCRYMSMTLRENQNKGIRPSLSNMRRAASLENMLDNDTDTGKPQITNQHRFTKRTDATNNSKPEQTSQHQQRYRPTSRRNDSMKRARSVETLLRYDPKSHTATGHSIPSELPVCERIVNTEIRDYNKNTKLLKPLANEEIVIVENKMKIDSTRKTASEEKVPMFPQKKRNIPEETELPPPDVVKQTLKIFEGTPSKKTTRITRAPGVSSKAAAFKNSGVALGKVNSSGIEVKSPATGKPILSPKPVLSSDKTSQNTLSPRKLPPPPPPPPVSADTHCNTPSPILSNRILALDTSFSPSSSPVISPTGSVRLKSPSPTGTGRRPPIEVPSPQPEEPIYDTVPNGKITPQDLVAEGDLSPSDDDTTDCSTKEVPRSALDNIRKDGTSMEFKFNNSAPNVKSKPYLPRAKSHTPTQQASVPPKVVKRMPNITSPALERQEFVTKTTSAPSVMKSPDPPQTQVKQVGVIRPIVNNAHPTSPPPSLTDREIEKNFINRTKSIEQRTSKVVVSYKEPENVVVGKVSLDSQKGFLDDSVKSVRKTLRNTTETKSSGLWDNKPWNHPQTSMLFDFTGLKGPVPSYIENDGMIHSNRKTKKVSFLLN
ncbi:hypothetical protein C0J52_21633 [Blattella germanica]|nr:hypothetical protein C0J52_21633 [Blattella germanica]